MKSLQRDYGYALAYGFAIGIWMSTAVDINESVFLYNSANFEAPGGAIYVTESFNVKIINSMFYENMAGINLYPHKTFSLKNGYPNNCTTYYGGDGVYSAAILVVSSLVAVTNCTFLKNTAYSGCIVGATVNSYITISDSNFTQNTVDSSQYIHLWCSVC